MPLEKGMIAPKNTRDFNVNRAGQKESVWQPLYHYQTYGTAGTTQLTFFQDPVGSGGRTYADTNMTSAGQLPKPQSMLVTAVQVVFISGAAVSVAAAPAANDYWLDMMALFESGWLEFFIGSKTYLRDAPIGKFSNDFRLAGHAAASDSTTAAAAQNVQIGYATFAGPKYQITPIQLIANQNFNVTLNWPAAVATPSGVDGRIGVILEGFLYRLSQ